MCCESCVSWLYYRHGLFDSILKHTWLVSPSDTNEVMKTELEQNQRLYS